MMNKELICYCGLYCGNCAVKVKVEPAAKVLYEEMKKAGFEDVINFIPGGEGFWPFLKWLAVDGMCISCKEGGGDPGCKVRLCAKEKNVEMCAFCESYPCALFECFEGYPLHKHDNEVVRAQGMDAWSKIQDERQASGFTYPGKESE